MPKSWKKSTWKLLISWTSYYLKHIETWDHLSIPRWWLATTVQPTWALRCWYGPRDVTRSDRSWSSALNCNWKKLYIMYRVEQQTLPVEFLLNFYRMLQNMNLKMDTDNYLVLKAWNIDSASVSVMTKITNFSVMLKNCHILYEHEFNDFYFSYIKGIH